MMSILIFITGTRAEKETETSENTDNNDALITLLKAVDARKEDHWSKIDEAYYLPLLNHKKYVEKLALAVVDHWIIAHWRTEGQRKDHRFDICGPCSQNGRI